MSKLKKSSWNKNMAYLVIVLVNMGAWQCIPIVDPPAQVQQSLTSLLKNSATGTEQHIEKALNQAEKALQEYKAVYEQLHIDNKGFFAYLQVTEDRFLAFFESDLGRNEALTDEIKRHFIARCRQIILALPDAPPDEENRHY